MSYIDQLVETNSKSVQEMLKTAIEKEQVTRDEVKQAMVAESQPVPEGGELYHLTPVTLQVLQKIQESDDRDMLIIIKKIFRSTKYAATTWYSVAGLDNNPHHLPIEPFAKNESRV
jgi:hypothetical protein